LRKVSSLSWISQPHKTKIENIFMPSLGLHGVDSWKKRPKNLKLHSLLNKGHFFYFLQKVKLCERISQRIHEKIWTILTFIRGLCGIEQFF
jgi:hypothetical protein